MCVGFNASTSSTVTLSLRKTFDLDARRDLAQPLDEVVGERIVVIDQNNHSRIISAHRTSDKWSSDVPHTIERCEEVCRSTPYD